MNLFRCFAISFALSFAVACSSGPGTDFKVASPDGTLSRFDGRRLLVALPSENVRVPDWAQGVVQYINGREYVVFPR